MHVYEEAIAREFGANFGQEVEAAMIRVQEKHHNRLVNEVCGLLHEEIMDARMMADPELAAIFAEAKARGEAASE